MEVLKERSTNIVLADEDDEEELGARDAIPMKERRMTKSSKQSRRRRRSSARFLRMEDSNMAEDDYEAAAPSTENLGEVYQNAIRMNAENRINASNSWNFSLIDHMDRFFLNTGTGPNAAPTKMEDTLGPITGVNFTRASCTLDASVKIYSYRVDDVHLTSYKVLANLNRTDNGQSKPSDADDGDGPASVQTKPTEGRQKRTAMATTETLETNMANLNIHKLDAAYDIDPLFHKMSKTFDEGGAKGLLLANLNVSATGCNIVFDSTLDDNAAAETKGDLDDANEKSSSVDITYLAAKLASSLNGQSVHQLPLVPQLAALRSEHALLKEEGFVEKVVPSQHYAASREDELEADRSIHVEAIERSRVSQAVGRSIVSENAEDETLAEDADDYAPDDFGGDDNDNEDFAVSFIHDGDHRFSSASFQTTFEASQPPSQATVLLDAIAAGDISGSQSNYEYFNKKALESIQGNQWAGATHWKKMQPKRKPEASGEKSGHSQKKKGRGTRRPDKKNRALVVDIFKPVDVKELMRKPPKGKKGSSSPLLMTKAAISKATKNENLLPLDAGLKLECLTSLFLHPNTNVLDFLAAKASPPIRSVGFGGIETWEHSDENSFGEDNNDGEGYNFGGGDFNDDDPGDFVVPELEGIRKVEKVRVGYATVAKKVDVKRLKKDLWQELEKTFELRGRTDKDIEDEDDEKGIPVDTSAEVPVSHTTLSFQDTVKEMQGNQSQADVTLPFYFICILHLANEKGLTLESTGLEDFRIHGAGDTENSAANV